MPAETAAGEARQSDRDGRDPQTANSSRPHPSAFRRRDFGYCLAALRQEIEYSKKDGDKDQGQGQETVARDPLLIAQRAQPLDISCRQIIDQFWIGAGGAGEMFLDAFQKASQAAFGGVQFA
jgi:hypothetical protein